jgi:UDP-glucose:(heptosyl)LPS alpha-1,3-glucosyltransferase
MREAGHQITIFANEVRASSDEFKVNRLLANTPSRAFDLLRFAYLGPALVRRTGVDLIVSFARAVNCDVLRSGGGVHSTYVRMARRWLGAARAGAMRLSPYHRVQMFIERRAFKAKSLRLAIAVSDLVRQDMISTLGLQESKAVTLYNGVDTDRFTPLRDETKRQGVRAELAIPRSAGVVIFVGNGFARKGLGYLIQSLPAMEGAPYLLVAGRDRAAHRYARLSEAVGMRSKVKFLGARADIPLLMQASDALALPSMFEPFGNVIAEAMASGLPVLTSRCCGAAEVVPAAFREFIVAQPERLGEVSSTMSLLMNRLLKKPAELRAAARAAAETLGWSAHGQRLERLLREAALGGGGDV